MNLLRLMWSVQKQHQQVDTLRGCLLQRTLVFVFSLLMVTGCIGPSLTSIPTVGGGSSAGAGSDTSVSASCPSTGTAVVGDVLATKTFVNSSGAIATGTMTNHGAFNLTGAFSGAGYVSSLTGLATSEVCSTTSILGSAGTAVCQGAAGSGTIAAAGQVCSGHYAYNASGTAVNGSATCLENTNAAVAAVGNIKLWFRPENLGALGANNSRPVFWLDSSSSLNHALQVTQSARPTLKTNELNGYAVVEFDSGSSQYLQTTDTITLTDPSTHAFTAIVVTRPRATQRTYADIIDYDHAAHNFVIQQNNTNTNEFLNTTLTAETWYVLTLMYYGTPGNVHKGYVNRVETYSNVQVMNVSEPARFAIAAHVNDPWWGRSYNGDIAEVIVFNKALSSGELTTVECYLSTKFSLGLAGC